MIVRGKVIYGSLILKAREMHSMPLRCDVSDFLVRLTYVYYCKVKHKTNAVRVYDISFWRPLSFVL